MPQDIASAQRILVVDDEADITALVADRIVREILTGLALRRRA